MPDTTAAEHLNWLRDWASDRENFRGDKALGDAVDWAIGRIEASTDLVGAACVPIEVLRGEVETGVAKEICPDLQAAIVAASDALREFVTVAVPVRLTIDRALRLARDEGKRVRSTAWKGVEKDAWIELQQPSGELMFFCNYGGGFSQSTYEPTIADCCAVWEVLPDA